MLYDVEKRKRLKEYRYPDVSFGNSGVAQKGGWFLGINYARLARFRPVTGYPATKDWTQGGATNPENDGIFRVEVDSGEKTLLVSYKQLAEAIREDRPDVDETELSINHTLCNPDNTRIFFFARGKFAKPEKINVPFTMNPDGSDLRPLGDFIGGHPEWFSPRVMIGSKNGKQVLFDIDQQKVTGELGGLTGDGGKLFPDPEGDVAMSPNGKMFVNGHKNNRTNLYTFLRPEDGAWGRTEPFRQGKNADDLRVDPGPCWNRAGDRIMVVAQDEKGTRQMFIVKVK